MVLSGGLTPDNVGEGIAATRPFAVDTASGTEAEPGTEGPGQARGVLPRRRAGRRAGGRVSRRPSKGGSVPYGGRYVPETLVPALDELEAAWLAARDDPAFEQQLGDLLRDYVGRPSPLYLAKGISERVGRDVWLKREDLNHTGAHKINNAIGQALLAKRMGKPRVIAETGAGQHGVASCDRLCAARPRLRRLHGHRGHAPPAPQRRADATAGRAGRGRRGRRAHAEGGRSARRSATGSRIRRPPTTSSARPSGRRHTPRSSATSSA